MGSGFEKKVLDPQVPVPIDPTGTVPKETDTVFKAPLCTGTGGKSSYTIAPKYSIKILSLQGQKTFVELYVTYAHPHQEFCTKAWSPWTRTDVDCLESVQRRWWRSVSGSKLHPHSMAAWMRKEENSAFRKTSEL
jgi:hypothetical protein